jgi:alpha-glucoside transport system substrate-binding protein
MGASPAATGRPSTDARLDGSLSEPEAIAGRTTCRFAFDRRGLVWFDDLIGGGSEIGGYGMRRVRYIAIPVVLLVLAGACSDDGGETTSAPTGGQTSAAANQEPDTGTVNVLNAMEPEEAEAVQALWDEMITPNVDYQVEFEASSEFEQQAQIRAEGGTLDVILLPQVGTLAGTYVPAGAISLEDLGLDISTLEETFTAPYVAVSEVDGQHYGVPSNINLKSMVWYPKAAFDAAGYTIPTTWDELMALSDQIVADHGAEGGAPWCVGFESGTATGWPATDWMEDIMLRTAGPETYDQWKTHEIPFNDPAVLAAGQTFGDVMFKPGYVLGGVENTPAVAFGDAPLPMFNDPPGCWLHRQASFINAFFPDGTEAGVDYDWFPLPPIDQEGILYGGEMAVTFRNSPEVVDFLNKFLAQDFQCAMGGEVASSRISPNVDVGSDCYVNSILAVSAGILTEALSTDTGRFDASDLMPAAVGSGSFWTGMVEYMEAGPDSLQGVLDEIEASWPTS